ncbi:uncharacterized protein YycO [Paenibacillus mucilaginosus]|uniref:hypothetical protein n=1 Tax=Paenibacillus mucilaginosus TaxID=61624 RepID=UPI003D1B0FD3
MSYEQIELQAGDILTACDNELMIPTGYLGHSAIAIGPQHLVEAVMNYPYIRVVPKKDFFEPHPTSAVYRPRDPEIGRKAAALAYAYYQQSERNRRSGIVRPPFSFSPQVPLQDPWTSVYCSKLVWISYYYGAGMALPNDHGLFTPEDIDTFLSRDPNFLCVYRHPGFHFFIDS